LETKFKIIRKLLNIKKNSVHTDKTILKYDTVVPPERFREECDLRHLLWKAKSTALKANFYDDLE
jgi:hypothetical protein